MKLASILGFFCQVLGLPLVVAFILIGFLAQKKERAPCERETD
jgi:Kef-type K+ transport system membrane component KefB